MVQRIYAHRGASGYAPENTLEAFQLAAEQGAHGVELDVQLSRDGVPVVVHDESIDRVSNGSGRVMDMTVKELKQYVFNRAFPQYKDARMPTLQEVFELLYPLGTHINIELKNSIIDYPDMERVVYDLAEKHGMTERILYSSFNHYSLLRVKKIDPNQKCGLLYGCILARPWEYAAAIGVDALHPHFSELTVPGECEQAHALGIEVNPWTLDDESLIESALKLGVDRLITDFPDRALKILSSRS